MIADEPLSASMLPTLEELSGQSAEKLAE